MVTGSYLLTYLWKIVSGPYSDSQFDARSSSKLGFETYLSALNSPSSWLAPTMTGLWLKSPDSMMSHGFLGMNGSLVKSSTTVTLDLRVRWLTRVNLLKSSVTRFGGILPLCQFFESFFLIWQNVEFTLATLLHYWANCCNWPNWKNNLTIWSHWSGQRDVHSSQYY